MPRGDAQADARCAVTFVITILVIGGIIAFVALQDKIIDALRPAQNWLLQWVSLAFLALLRAHEDRFRARLTSPPCSTPGAWAIPIGIMIILSFPPVSVRARCHANLH